MQARVRRRVPARAERHRSAAVRRHHHRAHHAILHAQRRAIHARHAGRAHRAARARRQTSHQDSGVCSPCLLDAGSDGAVLSHRQTVMTPDHMILPIQHKMDRSSMSLQL